jgi:hypothetical protein
MFYDHFNTLWLLALFYGNLVYVIHSIPPFGYFVSRKICQPWPLWLPRPILFRHWKSTRGRWWKLANRSNAANEWNACGISDCSDGKTGGLTPDWSRFDYETRIRAKRIRTNLHPKFFRTKLRPKFFEQIYIRNFSGQNCVLNFSNKFTSEIFQDEIAS